MPVILAVTYQLVMAPFRNLLAWPPTPLPGFPVLLLAKISEDKI